MEHKIFAVAADDSTTPYKDGFYEGEEITWLVTYDNGIITMKHLLNILWDL